MNAQRDTTMSLGPSSKIQLGLLVTVLGASVGGAVYLARLDGRVGRLEEVLTAFVAETRAERRLVWTAFDQAHFEDVLESANPTHKVPHLGEKKINNGQR